MMSPGAIAHMLKKDREEKEQKEAVVAATYYNNGGGWYDGRMNLRLMHTAVQPNSTMKHRGFAGSPLDLNEQQTTEVEDICRRVALIARAIEKPRDEHIRKRIDWLRRMIEQVYPLSDHKKYAINQVSCGNFILRP